jgi:hypothetical protein
VVGQPARSPHGRPDADDAMLAAGVGAVCLVALLLLAAQALR